MGTIVISVLLIAGAAFAMIAAVGALRMPDTLLRMHASTKAGTLGVGLMLAAVAVHFSDIGTVSRAVATIVFLLITAPVAAHVIGRASYRMGVAFRPRYRVDELAEIAPQSRSVKMRRQTAASERKPDRRD
ncbi:MAG: monovalent cation/H(+) antiporter subunit G [Inquilinaceae bacterium]